MVMWIAVTIASVGFIRTKNHSSWVGSFILTFALDLCLFDFTILLFAMIKRNNSKLLSLFKLKGFYVDVGSSSIITKEDEAALIAKIRKTLYTDSEKVHINDTSRGLTFANTERHDDGEEHMEDSQGLDITNAREHQEHQDQKSMIEEKEKTVVKSIKIEDFRKEREEEDVFNIDSSKEEKKVPQPKTKISTRTNEKVEKPSQKMDMMNEIDNTNINDLVRDIENIIKKPEPKRNSLTVKDTFSTRSKSRFKKL